MIATVFVYLIIGMFGIGAASSFACFAWFVGKRRYSNEAANMFLSTLGFLVCAFLAAWLWGF